MTVKGKLVASLVAALSVSCMVMENEDGGYEGPETRESVDCAYSPMAAEETARYALDLSSGDQTQAIEESKRLIEKYYGRTCDPKVVRSGQRKASNWIDLYGSEYVPKGSVNIVAEVSCVEVEAKDDRGATVREVNYPEGTFASGAKVPSSLLKGASCAVVTGETSEVLLQDRDFVRVVGK